MSFGHTKFGEGLVDFSFCKFRSGSLDFAYAVFNEAIVRFPSTDIGRIGVHFECAMFDKSALMFAGVGKKENALTITNATFTKSQINFPADFNTCSLNFVKAHFKNSCLVSKAYRALKKDLEARAGIEPTYKDLQSSA